MKIIVTGCAGFIGINYTQYLLKYHPEDEVVGVDCLTYAANISELPKLKANKKFVFYQANICDMRTMEEIFKTEKPSVVVNFAAESHVDRSINAAKVFIESNVLGVQILLDLCLKYGVKRFHQVSTDEVYGDLPIESMESFTEQSFLKPSSPYSASKAAADLLVLSYYKTHDLSVSISRSSNNYGEYQHVEKLIPKTLNNVLKGECIPVYGTGNNVRDWIYVQDNCRAIDIIVRKGASGEVYNVGGGDLISNIKLVRYLLERLEKDDNLIAFVEDRKGHDRKYALNCEKIQTELGWQPETEFNIGLQKTTDWYLQQLTNNID